MKFKFQFLIPVLLLTYLYSNGQTRAKFIVLESGGDIIGCESVSKDYIRGDMAPTYYNSDRSQNISSQMYKVYAGAKIEVRSLSGRFGFSAGLRFTQLNSSISKTGDPGYFYLLYQQTNTATEYLRVTKIMQSSGLIGVPLEVRVFPFPRLEKFRIYFMVGCEVGYQISTKNSVSFYSETMNSYQDGVLKLIEPPDKLYGASHIGAGINLGKAGKPGLNIGISAPGFISNKCSSLVKPNVGGGLRLQFLIPF